MRCGLMLIMLDVWFLIIIRVFMEAAETKWLHKRMKKVTYAEYVHLKVAKQKV